MKPCRALVVSVLLLTLNALLVGADRSYNSKCEAPSHPEHGSSVVNADGTKAWFYCATGYVISGASESTCSYGSWNRPTPNCVPSVGNGRFKCIVPDNPLNGYVVTLKGQQSFIYVTCRSGYEIYSTSSHSNVMNCEDGHWRESLPICYRRNPISYDDSPRRPNLSNPCISEDNGGCDQYCWYADGHSHCTCDGRFRVLAEDRKSCVDKSNNPCAFENGGCEHTCTVGENNVANCSCHEGYALESDGKSCKVSSHIDRSDPCKFSNGGCHHFCSKDRHGVAQCTCGRNYVLHADGKSCVENPCYKRNGGCDHLCTTEGHIAKCSCVQGYDLGSDEKSCTKITPCAANNGGCAHRCTDNGTQAVCSCWTGYVLKADGKSCNRNTSIYLIRPANCTSRFNERCSVDNGGCKHECRDTRCGTVTCHCRAGYYLAADGKTCLASERENPCDSRNGGCAQICTVISNEVKCSCRTGYTLDTDQRSCKPAVRDPCGVDNGGCSHLCVKNIYGTRTCECKKGFHLDSDGKRCKDIDECRKNNGGCEGRCLNFPGSYQCVCENGFVLTSDGKSCIDVNECTTNNGKGPCQGECTNTYGSFVCSCPNPGTTLAADKLYCDDINECTINNNGCSHECVNSYGSAYCRCPSGYVLKDDGKTCEDIDECSYAIIQTLCPNGCENLDGSYICFDFYGSGDFEPVSSGDGEFLEGPADTNLSLRCFPGYKMNSHGNCVDVDECETNNGLCEQLCINTPGSAVCVCKQGFEPSTVDNKICVDHDECADNLLGCSQNCINTRGSAHCGCNRGYQLAADGKTCLDIDECTYARCDHKCLNLPGSFKCVCYPGHIKLRNGTCQACRINSYKPDIDDDLCTECPANSYTVGTGKTSIDDCICHSGYTRDRYTGNICEDINECERDNFGCSHECINLLGSVFCSCPLGFQLGPDNKTCHDINECQQKNGGCDQVCTNTHGSFQCSCNKGYVLNNLNSFQCNDTDECSINNGGCSHTCINFKGGYYCDCPQGFKMTGDMRTCSEIFCPKPLELPNSYSHCGGSDHSVKTLSPVGMKCIFRCKKGFTLKTYSERTCQEDGTWSGFPPVCESGTCPALPVPENGVVSPERCASGETEPLEKCYFACKTGYELVGYRVNTCLRSFIWKYPEPTCQRLKIDPMISCPEDLRYTLPAGKGTLEVYVSHPTTNVDLEQITVEPDWIKDYHGTFPHGSTKVIYTIVTSDYTRNVSCSFYVELLDKEPPKVTRCPGTVFVFASSLSGAEATWKEPVFTDNVELASVYKSQKPGSVFTVGTHQVHYIARDIAGNEATCDFTVNVTRSNDCEDPPPIQHGDTSCSEWLHGKICEPFCDPGYAFVSNVSVFYVCDLSGTWNPRPWIPDCSPAVPLTTANCMPGSEQMEDFDTGEAICVECPPGMYWEQSVETCTYCEPGFCQQESGQSFCEFCGPEDESSVEILPPAQ